MREALFSIWVDRVRGARFLDLFAGSGAVGIEALSRGAEDVVLVEGDRRITVQLRQNAERMAAEGWTAIGARVPEELQRIGRGPFDLIFVDPPYAFEGYAVLLEAATPLLAPHGELALEHSTRTESPQLVAGLERRDRRVYGGSTLSIYVPS